MKELLATVTEREVTVEGLGAFRVRPPTVREALCVMATTEDWALLADECRAWLPPRLYSYIFARDAPKNRVLEFLLGLLSLGISQESDQKKVKTRARQASWVEIIAEYATTYRVSPSDVLEVPWPFFVAMSIQIPVQRAREMLRSAQWYAGAKTGKLDDVIKRARYEDDSYEEPGHMDEEWKREQLEKVRRLRQKHAKA